MARKKKKNQAGKSQFISNPFSHLKGFSVPSEAKPSAPEPVVPDKDYAPPSPASFDEEMALLGVTTLARDGEEDHDDSFIDGPGQDPQSVLHEDEKMSEDELFLAEMSRLDVRFEDSFEEHEDNLSRSTARRMKQLKKGKLVPDATLDLHGLKTTEVADKMSYFLQNARYHKWQTLLVITGKGLHSETGEAVLRKETERFIGFHSADIAEWGQAPQRYGGAGALVLFLRKKKAD